MIRATVFIDLPVTSNQGGAVKKTEVLSSKWPKTLRETSTDQRRATSFKDVKVGALNNGVILRNSGSRLLMDNTKFIASKFKLRGVVGVEPVDDFVPKEVLHSSH